MKYSDLNKEELSALYAELQKEYEEVKAKGLKLDMSRGKPQAAQSTLSEEMLAILSKREDTIAADGTDTANYGGLDGIAEAKAFIAEILDTEPELVSVWGNSSLEIMYNLVSFGYCFGVNGCAPWAGQTGLKFLCPVPGYDRHFAITEHFGFELINIPMNEDGPDMDLVEQYAADPAVKGIWCVPLYSNPAGICYSDETVRRFAALKPAAPDFRIYWDNAYMVHHLYPENPAKLLNILDEVKKYGNENLVYEFFSTSKITIPGDGIGAVATSAENLAWIRSHLFFMTVGCDKVNQLRHIRFLKNKANVLAHMAKHADILRPKFEAVEEKLAAELGGLGIASWSMPRGGYFISLNLLPGCAKRVVALCKEAGLVLTGAGATYPYKKDPEDKNIRIAPSFPTPEKLTEAAAVLTLCVKLAACEKLLG